MGAVARWARGLMELGTWDDGKRGPDWGDRTEELARWARGLREVGQREGG